MTNAVTTTTEDTASVALEVATVAPEEAFSKKRGPAGRRPRPRATGPPRASPRLPRRRREPKAHKKTAKPAHAKKDATPRTDSKGSKILALVGWPKGATLAEIMEATDWQAHSVRGFLSTASKKRGLKIESTWTEAGERTYRIAK